MRGIEFIEYRLTATQIDRFPSLLERSTETFPRAHIRGWAEVMPQGTVLAYDPRNPLAISWNLSGERICDQGLCLSEEHRDVSTVLGDEMGGFIQPLLLGQPAQ